MVKKNSKLLNHFSKKLTMLLLLMINTSMISSSKKTLWNVLLLSKIWFGTKNQRSPKRLESRKFTIYFVDPILKDC
jgi:hypothetical protein